MAGEDYSSRVAALVLVALVIAGVWLYMRPHEVEFTGLEVAALSAEFLESTQKDGGVFYDMECFNASKVILDCRRDECRVAGIKNGYCDYALTPSPAHTSSAWYLLANSGLYEATGNQTYYNRTLRALSAIAGECRTEIDCPGNYSSFDRGKCGFMLVQTAKAYEATGELSFKYVTEQIGGCDLYMPWTQVPMLSAIESRQYALLYSSAGNDTFLMMAEGKLYYSDFYLNQSFLLYSVDGLDVTDASGWVQLARLELYKATGNESHLNGVEDFYRKARLSDHLGDTDSVASILLSNIESLIILYDLTGDQSYADEAYALAQHFVTYYWDNSYHPVFEGDNGFLTLPTYSNTESQIKTVTDNSHAAYLFSQPLLKDKNFRVEVTKK